MNGKDENQFLESQVEGDFSSKKRFSSEKDTELGNTDHSIKKAKVEGTQQDKIQLMYISNTYF